MTKTLTYERYLAGVQAYHATPTYVAYLRRENHVLSYEDYRYLRHVMTHDIIY